MTFCEPVARMYRWMVNGKEPVEFVGKRYGDPEPSWRDECVANCERQFYWRDALDYHVPNIIR